MVAKLRQFVALSLMVGVLFLGMGHMALAASYGSGTYGACAYQTDCTSGASTASSGAPNTGLQRTPLLIPIIIGIIGISTFSFVAIRYLNRGHHTE